MTGVYDWPTEPAPRKFDRACPYCGGRINGAGEPACSVHRDLPRIDPHQFPPGMLTDRRRTA